VSGQAEVVAEGLHSSNGGELAIREIEPGAKPVLQAGDGFMKEEVEELTQALGFRLETLGTSSLRSAVSSLAERGAFRGRSPGSGGG